MRILYIMVGMPGSGKSAVAEYLADKYGLQIVSMDERRAQNNEMKEGCSNDEISKKAIVDAYEMLKSGYSVIFEEFIPSARIRKAVARTFDIADAVIMIQIKCPKRIARNRSKKRLRLFRGNVYDSMINKYEEVSESDVCDGVITVDTSHRRWKMSFERRSDKAIDFPFLPSAIILPKENRIYRAFNIV